MTLGRFMQLVEIKTKAASMIPFAIGSLYAVYRFHEFQWLHFVLMFVSLLSFDMATTAINNYIDYKKAVKTQGYGYEEHNAIVKYGIKEWTVVGIIFILLGTAGVAGFILFLHTNLVVLLLGGLSFLVGILYSFGPIPISRMPLGEIFSGLFMGFVIIFISTYVHVGQGQLVSLLYDNGLLHVDINILEVLLVFFISSPAIMGIANIMLANNISDMEDDIENRRYTLPVYIGKLNALRLFRYAYWAAYLDLIVLWALGVHPAILLLVLLTYIPINRNIKLFEAKQTKKDTFILSVRNFMITNVARIAALGAAILLSQW
ncbi:1,4-dihydroxy-2-naphthoate polyprenyltransferase [Paenibacillus sp. ACRRX]|uniref:1,4-dihydroxy-2-naphthoate polyprenyltransferase n=1 Tax=Paenibacillus sp. ACRRX TaxID=2918206 RepID=UPI001EF667F6|nr:1,4-dihydroxy-2-naphthoate polyprenyltransferase [Paenibacillus sp. ACRRX]